MKKFLKITGISFGVLLLAMIILPFLFKDKIKGIIDDQIKKNINGNVWYDSESFSLSLFKHFPNLSVGISDIGLSSNVEEFKGDTLFAAKEFSLSVDIMSVISGDQIKVQGIYLKQPKILTVFAKNGKMSWDITFPDSTATPEAPSTDTSSLKIAIKKWEIEDGTIIYDDQTMPMYAELKHLDHTGSGDMTLDVFDLKTFTKSTDVTVIYDGMKYLSGHTVSADAAMNIDLAKSVYTFMDNEFAVNDFKLGFDGSVEMPTDDIKMNITYKAKETQFKNLLSLVPAIYTKDFDKIKTDGTLGFDGYVKGIYNETTLPGFGLNLFVKNGFFQYPDLPDAVKNINIDLNVDDKDGVMDHTIVNLKQFHMDMGANPIDARLLMNGMNPYDLDANVAAKVKLEDIAKFYPIEGTTMKGLFGMDVKAKGKYSDSLKLMPVVTANMSLANGYVKSAEFPKPIENMSMAATVKSNGDMPTSTFLLEYFKLILDGDPFEAKAFMKNFDDPNYDVTIKGLIDLAKMTKIYPIENTTLTGIIKADLQTKGVLSEVQAGNYGNTQSSGSMNISDLVYKSTDLPQGFSMKSGILGLTPDHFNITEMNGMLGKSDYAITGSVSNYMGYMFGGKDTTIHGVMNMACKTLDVNEWMTDEEAPAATPADEVPMEVLEIPANVDFTFNSKMDKVLYSNMDMTNMTGSIIVRNSIVKMSNLKFNAVGGDFLMDGSYNAQDLKKPSFDMLMDMKNIEAKEAYKTFNTIKKMAPIANYVEGKFSMKVDVKGLLGQDMMPVYETLNGAGSFSMASAKITNNPVFATMGSLTKMNNLDPMEVKDVNIKYKIENGALIVAPFNVAAGQTKLAVLKGVNKLNGEVDYDMQLNTPSGALGSAASGAMSNLVGGGVTLPPNVIIDLNVSGPHDKPKVKILKTNFGEATGDAVKGMVIDKVKNSQEAQQVQQEIDKTKQQAEDELKKQQDAAAAELKKQQDAAAAEAEKQRLLLEKQKKAAEDSAKKKAADALKKGIPKF